MKAKLRFFHDVGSVVCIIFSNLHKSRAEYTTGIAFLLPTIYVTIKIRADAFLL